MQTAPDRLSILIGRGVLDAWLPCQFSGRFKAGAPKTRKHA